MQKLLFCLLLSCSNVLFASEGDIKKSAPLPLCVAGKLYSAKITPDGSVSLKNNKDGSSRLLQLSTCAEWAKQKDKHIVGCAWSPRESILALGTQGRFLVYISSADGLILGTEVMSVPQLCFTSIKSSDAMYSLQYWMTKTSGLELVGYIRTSYGGTTCYGSLIHELLKKHELDQSAS